MPSSSSTSRRRGSRGSKNDSCCWRWRGGLRGRRTTARTHGSADRRVHHRRWCCDRAILSIAAASAPTAPGSTGTLTHLGNDKDFASTRISYKLNLTGPSLNVQTACSTSLVAVDLACRRGDPRGERDMALAGAATVRVPQCNGYTSVKGGILSPDGHRRNLQCRRAGPFLQWRRRGPAAAIG